jgi:soluble lytic murein transglycosylase-like protein
MRIARFIKHGSGVILSFALLVVIFMVPLRAPKADEYQVMQQATPQSATESGHPHHIKLSKLANYIQKKYQLSERKAVNIVSEALRNAAKYENLEVELILAVIAVESRFQERVVSYKGARGLMQVLPQAHPQKVRAIGGVHALFDLEKNIYAGSTILADYLEDSEGDLRRALFLYVGAGGGYGRRYAEKVLRIYWDMRSYPSLG